MGLIGKNGAGKTTLLRLILGQEQPDPGTVEVDPGVSRMGYFSQFSELSGEKSVEQVLDEVFSEIHELEYALLEVESALENNPPEPELDRLLHRQSALLDEDGAPRRLDLRQQDRHGADPPGLQPGAPAAPIDQLSGGWRNRAGLAQILLEEPDILLMDEPTNYLDLEGLAWLEDWFNNFSGALLVVSHDRHFLDRVTTRIVEIENYHFHEYSGGFTKYVREKAVRLKTLERQFEHEEELLALEAEAISDRREALRKTRPRR